MELYNDPYQNFSDPSVEVHSNAADDDGIIEIDGSQDEYEETKLGKNDLLVDLDQRIPANVRQVYRYTHMSAGDNVCIIIKMEDRSAMFPYKMGIKNRETGEVSSAVVTGAGLYWVEVSEEGSYAIFIENCSDTALEVYGAGRYFFTDP